MPEEIIDVPEFDEVAEVLMDRPRAMSHLLVGSLLITLTVALVWAGVSRFDLTIKAPGAVRPSGEVARIHAQAGGVAREVLVREGDTVADKALLVRLDLAAQRAECERLATALATLERQRENGTRARASLLEQHALDARARDEALRRAEEKVRIEEQRVRAREDKAKGDVRVAKLELGHARTTEELKKKLFDAKLGSKEDWNQAVRARELSESRLAQAEQEAVAVDRADVSAAQGEIERLKADAGAQQKAAERERDRHDAEASRLDGEIAGERQRLAALQAELARGEVVASCAGTVFGLSVQRPGEVVQHGQEVAKIVPRGAPLVVEAYVDNADIAFVRVGMPARFRFHAFPYTKYGTLGGTVEWIAPDASSVEASGGGGGRSMAYKVRFALTETEFRAGGTVGRVDLGMLVEADVVTGSETVLTFLWRKVVERFRP